MIRFHRVFALMLRQYYLIKGSFSRLTPLFVWVTIDIVLWGFITTYLGRLMPGHDFVLTLLGAILLWDFFTRVMHGITIAFLEDVWSKNFLNVFSTPITLSEYLLGLVGTGVLTSFLGLLVMLALASLFFGLSFLSFGILFVPFVMVLFLFGIALGILACALVLRLGPSSEWFVWPIPMVLAPFVGVFYPLSTLPTWMHTVSYLLPPSYMFESMRALVATGDVWLIGLLIGLILAVLYILFACWVFSLVYQSAVKSGLIARYSAESVS